MLQQFFVRLQLALKLRNLLFQARRLLGFGFESGLM
jgi:hypothetical protein